MFEELGKYKYIIVTGPHRSGTTILANMIASDTEKVFLDEAMINHSHVRHVPHVLYKEESAVLQAPYALPWSLVLTTEDTLFVIVKRPIRDIKESLKRSVNKTGKKISIPMFSAEQAYFLWEKIKPLLHNTEEIQYKELKSHPLWISEDVRRKSKWYHKQVDRSGNRYKRIDYKRR